jgi:hypothetical protein
MCSIRNDEPPSDDSPELAVNVRPSAPSYLFHAPFDAPSGLRYSLGKFVCSHWASNAIARDYPFRPNQALHYQLLAAISNVLEGFAACPKWGSQSGNSPGSMPIYDHGKLGV